MCVPKVIRSLSVVAPVPPLATASVPALAFPIFNAVIAEPSPFKVPPCMRPVEVTLPDRTLPQTFAVI